MLNDQTSLAAAMICLTAVPCRTSPTSPHSPHSFPRFHMSHLCDRADVSGLTSTLTARLTLIYFLWNRGARGNNTEWHYLFTKSKAAVLGRVEIVTSWYRRNQPPAKPPPFHPLRSNSDCAMIRRSGESFNLIRRLVFCFCFLNLTEWREDRRRRTKIEMEQHN